MGFVRAPAFQTLRMQLCFCFKALQCHSWLQRDRCCAAGRRRTGRPCAGRSPCFVGRIKNTLDLSVSVMERFAREGRPCGGIGAHFIPRYPSRILLNVCVFSRNCCACYNSLQHVRFCNCLQTYCMFVANLLRRLGPGIQSHRHALSIGTVVPQRFFDQLLQS